MTSRSSSWVNLVENNKRRIWQWCIAIFAFVILNAVALLLVIMSMDESRYILDYGARAQEMMRNDARKYCIQLIGGSGYKIFMTTVMGALFAFGGFSYLNDKVKLDFYESVPVKRGDRFSTIWLNGIIMYMGTYIIGTLLCFAIINVMGYGDVYTMEEALCGFVKMSLYFLGVYHLYILSMMITGTAFAGLCAFLVLSVYEFAARGLVSALISSFFRYDYILETVYYPLFSPFGLLARAESGSYIYGGSDVKYYAGMLALDFVLLVISYIMYLRRPAEKAGKTLAYNVLGTPIKLLIGIIVSGCAAIITTDILDRSRDLRGSDLAAIILVCVITSILVCALIQAIFELDIKGALHKKIHWLICTLAAFAIFFGFKIDFFNIDRYVPDASKVDSFVLAPQGYDDNYSFIDDEYGNMRDYEFWLKNMYLTDVDSMRKLAKLSMNRYDEAIKIVGSEDNLYKYDQEFGAAVLMYRLKSGRVVVREIYIPVEDDEAMELLDKIISNSAFVHGYFGEMDYNLDRLVPEIKSYKEANVYTDGIHSVNLNADEVKELIRNYRSDMENFSFSERRSLYPVGFLDYEVNCDAMPMKYTGRYYGSSQESIVIYPNMTNCMNYLKDKGWDFTALKVSDEAASMDITNYHYDEQNEYAEEQGMDYLPDDMAEDFIKRESIDAVLDKDEFMKVADKLHPSERGYYRWGGGVDYDYTYEVFVYFKDSSPVGNDFRNGAHYSFLKDDVPESIQKALAL